MPSRDAAGPAVARAGNGVVYVYIPTLRSAKVDGDRGAIEFAPETAKRSLALWPQPGSDFLVMQKIKQLFDPKHAFEPREAVWPHLTYTFA